MLRFINYNKVAKKERLTVAMECSLKVAKSNQFTACWGIKGYGSLNNLADQIKEELAKYPRLGISHIGDNMEFEILKTEINIFHHTAQKGRGKLLFKIEEIVETPDKTIPF
jgi:hypothetical protein